MKKTCKKITIMKKAILSGVILFLGLISCNDESLDAEVHIQTLDVSINDIKSRVGFENGTGNFFWTSNDKIGVTTTTSKTSFVSMTLSSESGKSTGTFTGSMSGKPSGYAVYPYVGFENHSITTTGELTYKFPSEYTYSNLDSEYGSKTGNSFNAPMWAKVTEGEGVFFDHLGGVICITVNNLPIGSNQKFVLRTTNQIVGEFTADLTVPSPKLVTSASNSNNSVTINFSNTRDNGTGVFYVPVPTGTYAKIIAIVMNRDEEVGIGIWENQTVNQGSLKKATIGESSLEGGTATIYDVQTAGTLSTLISPEEQTTMTELKLKGEINGDDILFIRNMSKLETLDLSQVNIVEGGSIYYSYSGETKNEIGEWEHKTFEYTTSNNAFPSYFAKNAAFINTLSSVILPNSITKIGEYALEKCNKITTINIPDNVTEIGMFAFSQCNLNSIYIPQNLQTISAGAFMINPNLSTISIDNQNLYFTTDNGILYNKDKTTLLFCPMNINTEITIPDGVTEIYDFAFSNSSCSSLTLPESLVTIGNSAFMGARGLTQVIIPDNVTKIKSRAFVGCANIKNIIWSNSIETIEESCFEYCSNLQSIENTENVKYVKSGAFEGCI